jgi:hypothetical protein
MLIRYAKEAQADVIALPLAIKGRIVRLVERLERWPEVSGAKPLRGKSGRTISNADGRLPSSVLCCGR